MRDNKALSSAADSIDPNDLVDLPLGAKKNRISTRTIERMIARGLPCYRTSARGKRLIRLDELRTFLIKQQAAPANLDALINEVASSLADTQDSSKQRPRLTPSRRSL